jgi:hypothetical protein
MELREMGSRVTSKRYRLSVAGENVFVVITSTLVRRMQGSLSDSQTLLKRSHRCLEFGNSWMRLQRRVRPSAEIVGWRHARQWRL